jgi:hypothetical protein
MQRVIGAKKEKIIKMRNYFHFSSIFIKTLKMEIISHFDYFFLLCPNHALHVLNAGPLHIFIFCNKRLMVLAVLTKQINRKRPCRLPGDFLKGFWTIRKSRPDRSRIHRIS